MLSDVKQQITEDKEGEDVKETGKEVGKAAIDLTHPGLTDKIDKLGKLLDKVYLADTLSAAVEPQHATNIAISSSALSPTFNVAPATPIATPMTARSRLQPESYLLG